MQAQLNNIDLTADAQRRLDDYLAQVRGSLAGCRGVDADEVERDVLDHIEREFEAMRSGGQTRPDRLDLAALEPILDRLGSPTQWVPVEELSWWRQVALRLRAGPEDWRLAYLSFGIFVGGLLFVPIPPAFPVALLASFLLSRAALASAKDPAELGPRKWLLYPSLLVVCIPLAIGLLVWPAFAAGALGWMLTEKWYNASALPGHSSAAYGQLLMPLSAVVITALFAATALAAWLSFARWVVGRWSALLNAIFRPLDEYLHRKWLTWLTVFAWASVVLLSSTIILLWKYAD